MLLLPKCRASSLPRACAEDPQSSSTTPRFLETVELNGRLFANRRDHRRRIVRCQVRRIEVEPQQERVVRQL